MAPWRLRGYGAVLWYVIFGVVFISEEQIVMEAGRVVVSGIRRALVLALPWFGGWGAWAASDGAAAGSTPVSVSVPVAAAPAVDVASWAGECQTLEALTGIAGRVRGVIEAQDPKARDRVLAEAAMEVHTLSGGREMAPAIALEQDIRATIRNFQQLALPAFQMLEEQARWRRVEGALAARLVWRQRVLDGLRLWHKARQDPVGGLASMVQAEAMLREVRVAGQADSRLSVALAAIRKDIAAVPLPSLFGAVSGMELVRLPPPMDEWYVTRGPVTWRLFTDFLSETPGAAATGCLLAGKADLDAKTLRWLPRQPEQPANNVDAVLAGRCAAWLGGRLNGKGMLPGMGSMPLAVAAVPSAPKGLAWWTCSPWGGDETAARRWRDELGVKMVTLCDPDGVYGAGATCGELASAWGAKIGFWVVVPAETVAAERLRRLREELKPTGPLTALGRALP